MKEIRKENVFSELFNLNASVTLHDLFGLGVDVVISPQSFLQDGLAEAQLGCVNLGKVVLNEKQ